ncbi:cytochrome P450, partial [Cerioporus squamosus]
SFLALVPFVTLIILYARSLVRWNSRARGRPLPPGPRGLPFFGNVFDLRKGRPWLTFNKLREKYGAILYFEAFRSDAVLEYLDRRSANTSDRLKAPSISLTGHEWSFGLMPYGPAWRRQRRIFWQYFHPGAIDRYRPFQLAAMHTFLAKVAGNPDQLDGYIQYTFTTAVLKMAYGIDVKDEHDEVLTYIDTGLQGSRELIIGGFLVDFFPVFRHMPSFLPGCGFHKLFARWRKDNKLLRDMPFRRYEEAVVGASGTEPPSTQLIRGLQNGNKTPACILTDIISSADAGSDTVLRTLLLFDASRTYNTHLDSFGPQDVLSCHVPLS